MWTLECDGDLFGGKSIWLRPGHKLIFGRTKPAAEDTANEQSWIITHKSVSRKHLVIDVCNVAPGSADDLRERTEIRLIDNSKLGTTLDGHKFKDANVALSKVEHIIMLGSWEQKFIIKWRPVVLTPSMLSTKQKKAADPLSNYRERVESLGIKLSLDYIVGQTTHVIANKRNSAKNLQALINGKYVITEAFLEAILSAATPTSNMPGGDGPTQAPLEVDFEANWPDALDYVPASGKEPVPRSPDLYAPKESRLDMFSGHTVIFLEQVQLDNLQDVINNGGGKAVLYNVSAGNTDITQFVTFVTGLKPQKTILVRFRGGDEEDEQWKKDFQQASQLALSQRSIDQNEFLDAIIMSDVSSLKQPLQEEVDTASSIPPPRSLPTGMRSQTSQRLSSQGKANSTAIESQSQPVRLQDSLTEARDAPAPRKRTFRAPYKSRFTGVDDFDPTQITKYADDGDDDGDQVGMADFNDENEPSAQPVQSISRDHSTRKRTHGYDEPSSEPVGTAAILDQMTSANDRYKRRKVTAGGQIESVPEAAEKTPPKPVNAVVQAMENLRRVRQRNEVGRDIDDADVKPEKSKMKARRAELEEERLRQEEGLREQIGDIDPSEIRARIRFEEMSISSRSVEPARGDGSARDSDRWDDRWNGRKNFKRFRRVRRGGDADDQSHPLAQPRRVIVALEEMRKNDFGLGEGYWLEDRESTSRQEGGRKSGEHVLDTQQSRDKAATSQSQATRDSNGESTGRARHKPTPRSLAVSASSGRSAAADGSGSALGRRRATEEEDSEPENVEAVENSGSQLRSGKVMGTQQSMNSTTSSKRRAAAIPLQEAPTSSKRRATTRGRRARGDDSSDEELRFKFKRKG